MQAPLSPPTYLTEQESRLLASRHLLSFLFAPDTPDRDPADLFDRLLSVDSWPEVAFTDAPELFRWKSRIIYDVDSLQLFHDHSIQLDEENEIMVRVAASDVLGTPVWSIEAGPEFIRRLTRKTLEFIASTAYLKPVLDDGGKEPMIVCYSYPKLGILCLSDKTNEQVVVDLADPLVIPAQSSEEPKFPSLRTVWSPYDFVRRGGIGFRRWLWRRKLAALPEWKADRENLHSQIRLARQGAIVKNTNPKLCLVGQQNDYYCAPATARMLLKQHGTDLSQDEIAGVMQTSSDNGTSPENQESAIAELTGWTLEGELDHSETFTKAQTEILANRPLKTGTVTDHARACGGYKLHNGIQSLNIYDPYPSNLGRRAYEDWDAGHQENFMYVRPA